MSPQPVFEIVLQRAENVYFPGQIVQGRISLELKQQFKLSTIRIAIKGRAFVHWTEQALRGPGEPRYKDTRHHSAIEDYFDHSFVLFGQAKHDRPEKCYLPAGRYTYPFRYQLPPNLPSSFEGEYGYIRYWVKATIEKGREQCHVTQKPFTVISPLDLNKVPDSNTTIYKTPTKCRSVSKQICKTRRHSVSKGETDTWMSDQLMVPPLPPSCLIGCSIISIKYTLELRVDPVGPAFDLTLPIEVVIGTIPHRSVQEHQSATTHQQPSNSNGTDPQRNVRHENRHVIGVQVLPVQGGHLIVNPAHSQQSSNRASGSSAASSERSNQPPRPPSRTSSAPSTASTMSLHQRQMSTVFLESPYGRMTLKFEGDRDKHIPESQRFAPVYPFYQWRR